MKYNFFRKPIGIVLLCLILLLCVLLAVRVGSTHISTSNFVGGLFRAEGYRNQSLIIYSVRLPRVLGAILAGIGLSVSGVLLQSVTANELASPNIIGVNSGAGLAVILLLWLFPNAAMLSPIAAFAGAFITTLLIVSIASKIQNTASTVILAGVALTAMLNAGISFVSLVDTDVLATYSYFSVGGLSSVKLEELFVPATIIVFSLAVSLIIHRRIDILCLGDNVAVSLGINVKRLRIICLVLASASAASVVSFAGLLGFVGLVIPHISRKLCGNSSGVLLTVSALLGAILVVIADVLGRILFAPSEIPVGIVMAFLGAPFFFWLLLRKGRYDGI